MPTDYVPLPVLRSGSAENSVAECRRTERVQVMRSVAMRASDGREFSAFCTDVNLSGIGMDSEHVLKVGQRVELSVKGKNGEQHRIPLMVIYRMDRHYGLSALASQEDLLELLPEQA